jgi:hypothetical protein
MMYLWGDPLHAFKKVSNVFSLRMVAAIRISRAAFRSKNPLIDETKVGIMVESYVCD